MKGYLFEVIFRGGQSVHVYASNRKNAIIVARGKRIESGLDDRWMNVLQLSH